MSLFILSVITCWGSIDLSSFDWLVSLFFFFEVFSFCGGATISLLTTALKMRETEGWMDGGTDGRTAQQEERQIVFLKIKWPAKYLLLFHFLLGYMKRQKISSALCIILSNKLYTVWTKLYFCCFGNAIIHNYIEIRQN